MNNIYLNGSEDVSRAGHNMQSAAETMSRAASHIESSLELHRQFMNDWLFRLENALKEKE